MALCCPLKGLMLSSHTSLTSAGAYYCSSCPGHPSQQLPILSVSGSLFAPKHPAY